MNQCVTNPPVMPATYAPVQQPNYNAVKIDIINPSVGTPGCGVPQACPQQPQAPIYNYPQAPIYNYPQAQTFPCAYPPVAAIPQTPAVEGQTQDQTQAQQPVIQQQNNNAPVQTQVVQSTPVEQKAPEQPVAEVPAPKVSEPEIVPAQEIKPQVDLNGIVEKLSAPDFEGQLSAMENIADMVKDTPDKAEELVDTKVFDALNAIITNDTSNLEGPTQAQFEARQKISEGKTATEEETKLANTLAPRELADRNKSYALFTVAILDKLYTDVVQKLTNEKRPLTDLPSAVTLVDQLKDNPNPMVRSSAIEALSYLQCPEYKKDLTTLFTVAKNDQDPVVVSYANAALEKLNQV